MTDLPLGWSSAEVHEIADLVNGYPFKPTQWKEAGIPIIRIQNLNDADANFNFATDDLPPKYRVESGALLFAWSGTPGTSFGAHIWRGPEAWLNQHIFRVIFNEKNMNKAFLKWAINRNLSQYISAAHGGAGLAHITKGLFERSVLPIPPLAEQDRIVAEIEKHFSRLDAAVAALERARTNLKRYRAAVLQAAVEGRLVSEDVTSPETWIRVRFEEILTFLRNGISKKPDAEEGLPILRISAVRPGAVDLSDVRFLSGSLEVYRDYVIEPGDLLFTRYNGNPDFVGVCGAVRKVNRPTLHPDKLIRAKVKRDMASARYLEIALNTGEARQFLARRVRTTAGQSGVSGGDIRQIPLSLPPLEDQERIACEVERRSLVIDSLQASLAVALVRADRLRQSVLKRAFEGKLVPQDSNDEAASILLDRIRAERVRAPSTNRRRSPRSRGAEAMAAE